MSNIYAYIRVSSRTQKEDRQVRAIIEKYNITPENIIIEKASGKNFIDRTEYNNLRKNLNKGDLLVITSLDRLGRNMKETSKEWDYLTSKGIDIDVMDMPILSTRNNQAGLTGELINKLIITILAYAGEKERNCIKERQREGIDTAKEKGVKFGRPRKEKLPAKFIEYCTNERLKPLEIQKVMGISKSTYYRWFDIARNQGIIKNNIIEY